MFKLLVMKPPNNTVRWIEVLKWILKFDEIDENQLNDEQLIRISHSPPTQH